MRFTSSWTLASVLLAAGAGNALAGGYVPARDDQVLERLAFKPSDPLARELGALRAQLRGEPQNRELAVKLARRYYEMVGEEGDPRYLGYAQAALAPWWELKDPPTDVQVLRASLRQFLHDFDGALADLDRILQREPDFDRARALRAILHIVQARYAPARKDCEVLKGGPNSLVGIGCEAMVDGLTGKTAPAYQALGAALAARPGASADEKMWIRLRLAELAQRRNRLAEAETQYRAALALNITDTFLYAAYADLLLDLNRPADVVQLLKEKVRSDVLLLRLAFAERALNLPSAKESEAALAARFHAAQLRGDTVHQQEEARFALLVEKNPAKALRLAQENWKVQREPRDARIFLEAAIAARDRAGAAPVLAWLAESGIEDPLLVRLGKELTGGVK